MNEIWRMFSNSSIEDDRNAVCFIEPHNYVDDLEAAFVLGIADFKKGRKFVPGPLGMRRVEWGKGWLAMKCLTKRKEPDPPPKMTWEEFHAAKDWRWEKFKELALSQGVDIGERGG